ncbi:MAG: peptidase M2 family protein [Luteitalea sp.]|nr:peptidase M2 family protein [Luteitalea sp.]
MGSSLLMVHAACRRGDEATNGSSDRPGTDVARQFVEQANARLLELGNRVNRAQWIAANFITEDTQQVSADATAAFIGATMELAQQATRFDDVALPDDVRRQLTLLKLATIPLPAPSDPKAQAELTRITTGMEAAYGKGMWCPPGESGDDCLDINELTTLLAENRDPARLRDAWIGWHEVGRGMRDDYQRFVELANAGARELGYDDLGALWRSNYDVAADQFTAEVERLWAQVQPLYTSLHAYVRGRLGETYGTDVVPPDGAIPAHLLGNMWAQQWGNIYPLVAPPGSAPSYDLTTLLLARNVDAMGMVKYGEGFFTSLGFAPLPQTFWERSLFTKPRDRDVVCHASAWDVDNDQDVRIKMCIQITGEDFVTIHHELGHNFYQRAYRRLPVLYRDSANDGFHEAIGDAVALSVTPSYLAEIGLLDRAPDSSDDVGYLLRMALDKVAFLPFGLLVDQWRWKVFSGEVTPATYNQAWWNLRAKYQGVSAPSARSEDDFDPGAKYHVPGNTPYTRYFLAHILQFQFHRAMCKQAGYTGPLHRCSIYGNKAVGQRFRKMLEMGRSRPWPDALETLTGERQLDASAILEYFAPLKRWLDEQARATS